jgi:hypothetical protein
MIKQLLQRRTSVPSRERADARRQEDDVSLWRDYHTFLKAKLTLLEARVEAARVAFERSDAREGQAEQAEAALDRIPAGIRALFEAVLEERRQQLQTALEAEAHSSGSTQRRQIDPDTVDRQTLAELLAEAEGEVATETTPKGYGFFPRGTPGDVRWYALDVAELLAAPTAASYTVVAEQDDTRRRIFLSVGAGLFAIGFLVVWFLMPHGVQTREAAALTPLVSDGTTSATPIPMDVWPVQRVVITLANGQQTTIAVAATTSANWPATTEAQPAYWQRNAFAPLRLCLAPELLDQATAMVLGGGGGWPDRLYAISANQSSATNLALEPCPAGGTARRYGVLQQMPPLPAHGIGEPITLPGKAEETITVQAMQIAGPGQDPALPEGQARITVAVEARRELDWPSYAPTLLLPSGQAYLPAETVAVSQGAELRYLVPLPTSELPIAWELTIPGSGQVARWRAILTPPINRVEVLRGALAVLDVSARKENGAVTISFSLVNHGPSPLQVTREDIVLTEGERRLPTPAIGTLTALLEKGERRTIVFSLPLGQQPLTLTIGTQAFRITT